MRTNDIAQDDSAWPCPGSHVDCRAVVKDRTVDETRRQGPVELTFQGTLGELQTGVPNRDEIPCGRDTTALPAQTISTGLYKLNYNFLKSQAGLSKRFL